MSDPVIWKLWRRDHREARRIRVWSRRILKLDKRMLDYVSAFVHLQQERRSTKHEGKTV